MLGLTSYQEALRALGSLLEVERPVCLAEHVEGPSVEIDTPTTRRVMGPGELEALLLSDHARRGDQRPAGTVSDLLRAVGRALDELHASDVSLRLSSEALSVHFRDQHQADHVLSYAGDELDALIRAAVARRNGQPLRRVLILHTSATSAAPVVELLIAEFAVQALPTLYARAVAAAAEPPDLIVTHGGPDLEPTLNAIRELRKGGRTRDVPVVLLAAAGSSLAELDNVFRAGVDDLLEEPVQPAQLRARLRTWMLRKPVSAQDFSDQ